MLRNSDIHKIKHVYTQTNALSFNIFFVSVPLQATGK